MQKTTPPNEQPFSAYAISNPEEMMRNILKVWEEGAKVMAAMVERADAKSGPFTANNEITETTKTLGEVARQWMSEPQRLAEEQANLMKSYVELWQGTFTRMLGGNPAPVAVPEAADGRFRDPEWTTNAYFDFWKQAYLITSQWADRMLAETASLDEPTRHKAEYYFRQVASALSPSNFPATNPEILREIIQTNGLSLVRGLEQLKADMGKSGDLLKISQTDTTTFEVGRNLAVTPGKVVFQNEILQLIQYTPTTAKVHENPVLIVPPWINKFYILDLTSPKSFVRYLVEQGFTTFLVSWVNPDERLGHKTFEDYMKEGILSATDAVLRETGAAQTNILGYCVGGTLLASTLAYTAGRGQEPFSSATFLAAQADFTRAGDLKLFTDDAQLKAIEATMAEKGYLDGSRMATVFNNLRPRDLVWPYIVNNYMMGKKPLPFDLLFWNQDSTRMPAANHNYYLREFYLENRLANGQMTISGVRLDLSKVRLPIYELATREDHIAPAESVYIGSRLFGGPVEFVLAGSGHIAGVVNPPPADGKRHKYQYWTNSRRADTLADWMRGATETPGSWWPHWTKWLAGHSGGQVAARQPGAKLGAIEDAPGSYVRAKG